MTNNNAGRAGSARKPVLNPVDRISEMLFGLLMALSFTGAVAVGTTGHQEIRVMFAAALGCNHAWGLVDGAMYLVRTVTDRGRTLTLLHAVRAATDVQAGREIVERELPGPPDLFSPAEIEAVRARIVALPSVADRPRLEGRDLLAALGIFLLVVVATFPVVLPFAFMHDVGAAKNVSRAVALVMLFLGGLGLGRHAGYGGWRAGFAMVGLGIALVLAIHALGG